MLLVMNRLRMPNLRPLNKALSFPRTTHTKSVRRISPTRWYTLSGPGCHALDIQLISSGKTFGRVPFPRSYGGGATCGAGGAPGAMSGGGPAIMLQFRFQLLYFYVGVAPLCKFGLAMDGGELVIDGKTVRRYPPKSNDTPDAEVEDSWIEQDSSGNWVTMTGRVPMIHEGPGVTSAIDAPMDMIPEGIAKSGRKIEATRRYTAWLDGSDGSHIEKKFSVTASLQSIGGVPAYGGQAIILL